MLEGGMTQDGIGGLVLAAGFVIFMIGMAVAGSNLSNQREGSKVPTFIIVVSVIVMITGGLLVAPCEGGDCAGGEVPDYEAAPTAR
jgi:hypothetical protein